MAVGGIHVRDESLQELEGSLQTLCMTTGFPDNEVFKWSPRRGLWMHSNLKHKEREDFFVQALTLAINHEVTATIVLEDTSSARADATSESVDIDLMKLFLERVHNQLARKECKGVVVVAQPGGDRQSEHKFLANCVETLKWGTDYVKPDRIALNVLSSPAKFHRLLQLADVVTSCTTSFVSGETKFSPTVFDVIKKMLVKEGARIGGIGLKIHPDFKYGNLYHWLVGDTIFWKHSTGLHLPWPGLPYSSGPDNP